MYGSKIDNGHLMITLAQATEFTSTLLKLKADVCLISPGIINRLMQDILSSICYVLQTRARCIRRAVNEPSAVNMIISMIQMTQHFSPKN